MSAGQFKKGAPSPNPAGRPSKFESALRQIKLPLEAMGVTEQEIWALATAFSEDSDFAISIVTTMICLRLEAKTAKAASEASESSHDFF